MNKLVLQFCCLLALAPWAISAQQAAHSFTFYDQAITLSSVNHRLSFPPTVRVQETALRSAYQKLNTTNYQPWLTDLQQAGQDLRLNDWLYCELVQTAVLASYGLERPNAAANFTVYFLLAKSGFDVRLTYRDQRVFVNIYTEDELFEVPLIQESGRSYANISMMSGEESRMRQSMFLLDHHPNPRGLPCSFLLKEWPQLYVEPQQREIAFQYHGLPIEVPVQYNAGIPKLLANYPLVSEQWYLEAPLSVELKQSLVQKLEEIIKDMKEPDALALIASLTRSSFRYRNDNEVFGSNKPMVGDELFFYPYSDCEDRSALFYALVKETLQLPMIVIAYDDHLTIAVASEDLVGDAVRFEGQKYIFCDPTGPSSSSEIGQIPSGYEDKSFEIIGVYDGR